MITRNDFTTESVQLTAFAPPGQTLSIAKLLRGAITRWASEYDGDPVSLPLPPEAPAEIPRLLLSNSSGTQRIEASLNRITSISSTDNSQSPLDVLPTAERLAERLGQLFSLTDLSPARAGLVLQRVAPVTSPAGTLLAQHFFKDRWLSQPFNRPETLELHSHKRYAPDDSLEINSWFRIKTAILIATNSPAIVVEQDLNTLEEHAQSTIFTESQLIAFAKTTAVESEAILSLYFPLQ